MRSGKITFATKVVSSLFIFMGALLLSNLALAAGGTLDPATTKTLGQVASQIIDSFFI